MFFFQGEYSMTPIKMALDGSDHIELQVTLPPGYYEKTQILRNYKDAAETPALDWTVFLK